MIHEVLSICTYIFLHSIQDQRLQFVETVINTCTSPLLHDWLVTLKQQRRQLELQFSASSEPLTSRFCEDQVTSVSHCTVQTAVRISVRTLPRFWAGRPTLLKKTTVNNRSHTYQKIRRIIVNVVKN